MVDASGLRKKFAALPTLVRSEVEAQLEKEAAKVVAEMKAQAPFLTGAVRDSIGWTWGDEPKGALKIGTVANRKYGTIAITIYAGHKDAFYALFQEFGTSKMPANPFFFPIWRDNKTRVKSSLSRAITRAVKKANS